VTPVPKWIEHGEPGGVKLYDPKLFTPGEVGVEPPTQVAVKALGAIDVRNRDDDGLELQVDRTGSRGLGCSFVTHLGTAHVTLLRLVPQKVGRAARRTRPGSQLNLQSRPVRAVHGL